jgi:hypothetical protein
MAVAKNPDGSGLLLLGAGDGVSAPRLFRLAIEPIAGEITAGWLSAAFIVVSARAAAGAR